MCADMLPHNVPFTSEKVYGAITPVEENGNVVVEMDQLSIRKPFEEELDDALLEQVVEPNWGLAEQIFKRDESIEVTITGFNKGGLLTNWGGLPGFLPASQLEHFPECHLVAKRLKALSEWVGQQVTVKVIELEPGTRRLILSERAAAVTADDRSRVLNQIRAGDRLEGRVTNLADFGVFVDLGGVEGLIHISELSWGRVLHPEDILRPGQMVEVLVLQVSPALERVALSRKRLLPNPWQAIEERYEPGQLVRGVITNIAKFGAFAEVEEGLEGLIHLSELSEKVVSRPHEVVKKGEEVVARVLRVDGSNRRLALSLKSGRE